MEHLGRGVGDDDPCGGLGGKEALGNVARPAGKIQNHLAGAGAEAGDEGALPCPVGPERHQVVHPVVVGGDAGENLADEARLFFLAHPLSSEAPCVILGKARRRGRGRGGGGSGAGARCGAVRTRLGAGRRGVLAARAAGVASGGRHGDCQE